MTIENMIEDVQCLKEDKKEFEQKIEDIKLDIIKTKNEFYKQNENYDSVVSRYAELDSLLANRDEDSVNKLNSQLANIITKVFDKIISKKTDLETKIEVEGREIKLGLNNRGIGRLTEVWSYYRRNDEPRPTRLECITDLETYLYILKDRELVNKIKNTIHKKEKKEMLDVLHKYLKDWKTIPSETENLTLTKPVHIQSREGNSYYDSDSFWDIKLHKVKSEGLQLKFKNEERYRNNKTIQELRFNIFLVYEKNQHRNKTLKLYGIDKPDKYSRYDLEDTYFASCQVWDLLEPYVEKAIKNIKVEQKLKMKLLESIWNGVQPYLMVDAI